MRLGCRHSGADPMTQSALLLIAVLMTLALLGGCGPMSIADAERLCLARAYDAAGPHGEVAMGVANGTARTRVTLDISTDAVLGRDPSAVYDQCVFQKTGQPPCQPLSSRADWKG
jgi:hypothetical protein